MYPNVTIQFFAQKQKIQNTKQIIDTRIYLRRAASAALHEYGRLHVNTVYSVYSRYINMYKFNIIILYMYTTRLSTYYT